MLDLWSGLFAALIGAVIGIVGSVIGAWITGRFMLEQQERDSRRRAVDALRALRLELVDNEVLVLEMIKTAPTSPTAQSSWPARKLQPRLRRSIWETHKSVIAGFHEPSAIDVLASAYRNIDALINDFSLTVSVDVLTATRIFLQQAIVAVRHAAGLPETEP